MLVRCKDVTCDLLIVISLQRADAGEKNVPVSVLNKTSVTKCLFWLQILNIY